MIHFIVPAYNCHVNACALIDSLIRQHNSSWHCTIIDDCSDDDTAAAFDAAISTHASHAHHFNVIKNDFRLFALRNVVEHAFHTADDEIIACLDGDDSLCNDMTVDRVIDTYRDDRVDVAWTAHRWNRGGINISCVLPDAVDPYQWKWCSSHLKTFRTNTIKRVNVLNFKNMDAQWFERGYDQALMLPILFNARKRKRVYIDSVCYAYNIDSCAIPYEHRNWAERSQLSTIALVRARGYIR